MSDDLVKAYVRKWLAANEQVQDAYDTAAARLKAAGKIIVTMGQVGSYGDDGKADWEVRDNLMGELLASGRDDVEGFAVALKEADPEGRWVNVDALDREPAEPEPIDGIPESLCEALVEWLESKVDAEELAEWLGEPVEVIERQMRG
jgi:hypothetical protein